MRLINKSYKQDRLALDEMQRKQRAEFDKSQREEISAFRDAVSGYGQEHTQGTNLGRERERTLEHSKDPH